MNMFSKIKVVKDVGQFREGDILEFNFKTNKYNLTREFEDISNNKVVTRKVNLSLSPDFIKEYKGYFEVVEDAELIDERDLQIAELKQEVNRLKYLLSNKFWF